jgi:hypothetical protein
VLRRLVKVSPENSPAERVKNFTRSPFLPNAFQVIDVFVKKKFPGQAGNIEQIPYLIVNDGSFGSPSEAIARFVSLSDRQPYDSEKRGAEPLSGAPEIFQFGQNN